jgi:hypothetical protein
METRRTTTKLFFRFNETLAKAVGKIILDNFLILSNVYLVTGHQTIIPQTWWGLYYKHATIINDNSSVISK